VLFLQHGQNGAGLVIPRKLESLAGLGRVDSEPGFRWDDGWELDFGEAD
jgi:hypothetical protein